MDGRRGSPPVESKSSAEKIEKILNRRKIFEIKTAASRASEKKNPGLIIPDKIS